MIRAAGGLLFATADYLHCVFLQTTDMYNLNNIMSDKNNGGNLTSTHNGVIEVCVLSMA